MHFNQIRMLSTSLAMSFLLTTPMQLSMAEQSLANPEAPNITRTVTASEATTESSKTPVALKNPTNLDSEKFIITKTPIPLKSYLGKKYSGYKISLQNQADMPLEIVSTDVTLGMGGQQAYKSALHGSKGAMAGIIGGGVISGLVTFGIGFAISLIIAPIYGGIKHSKNKKARQESVQFSNQPPSGILKPGETLSFMTLVPLGCPAFVEAIVKDATTGQTMVVSK